MEDALSVQVLTQMCHLFIQETCNIGAHLLVQVTHLLALSQLGVGVSYFRTCQKPVCNLTHNYDTSWSPIPPQIYLPVGNRQKHVEKYSTFMDLFLSCPGHRNTYIPYQECITPHDGGVILEFLKLLRTGSSRFPKSRCPLGTVGSVYGT